MEVYILTEEVQRETGSKALVLKQLDLTSLDSVRKFCKEIIAEEPRLDILVNNAGLSVTGKNLTKDKMEVCMQTNHFSPFLLTHLLLGKFSNLPSINFIGNYSRTAYLICPAGGAY